MNKIEKAVLREVKVWNGNLKNEAGESVGGFVVKLFRGSRLVDKYYLLMA